LSNIYQIFWGIFCIRKFALKNEVISISFRKKQKPTLEKMTKVAVGIDLGTTFSCIAVYVEGKVEVLTDSDGNRTMPSIVAFTEDEIEVGQLAKENVEVAVGNRVYGKPFNNTVQQPKNLLNSGYIGSIWSER
jgi:hypothetical protein